MSSRIGINFSAKLFSASSDSQTSTTRKPFSPCPGMWARRPSTGQSAGDSMRLLPPVSRRMDSSYCSCVTPSWTSTTGTATSSHRGTAELTPTSKGAEEGIPLEDRDTAVEAEAIVTGAVVADVAELPPLIRSLISSASEILVIAPVLPGWLQWLASDTDRVRQEADERLEAVLAHVETLAPAAAGAGR